MIERALAALREQTRPESLLGALGALVLLVALGGYLYVLAPALEQYRELEQARAQVPLASDEVLAAARHAALVQLEHEVAELRSRLVGGGGDVPAERTEAWIIDRLDELSARYGVELVSVSPEARRRVLMFEELPYELTVRASYFGAVAWLHAVEHELRPLVVKEFALRGEGDPGGVRMELRLVSYRLREEAG